MFDPKDSPWYAGAAAGIFWFVWYLRRLMRRDKEDGSASGLTVSMTDATQRVIKMLEKRIDELVKEVQKLRQELQKVLQQNDECNRLNLRLTNDMEELTKRMTVVEKEAK